MERKKIEDDPKLKADEKKVALSIMKQYEEIVIPAIPVLWGLTAVTNVLIAIGAVKMMNLSSRGWGTTAAVLAMIPCISGCCLLGVPVGIWALVALSKPDVKAAFAQKKRASTGFDDEPA